MPGLILLITDDHKIVRDGLKEILKNVPEISRIEEARDGKETLKRIAESDFDLILLDIALPDVNGLDVLQSILSKKPGQKVLMLSMYPQEQYAVRAMKAGASGYLTKNTAAEELIEAIKKIKMGGKYISASLASYIVMHLDEDFSKPRHELLSEREFQILLKIAAGKSLKEIGSELNISDKTVSTYRSRVLDKMGMKKNAEITQYCLTNGLIVFN
jgi:DNA-binding NarL/FixJ family response regulator